MVVGVAGRAQRGLTPLVVVCAAGRAQRGLTPLVVVGVAGRAAGSDPAGGGGRRSAQLGLDDVRASQRRHGYGVTAEEVAAIAAGASE